MLAALCYQLEAADFLLYNPSLDCSSYLFHEVPIEFMHCLHAPNYRETIFSQRVSSVIDTAWLCSKYHASRPAYCYRRRKELLEKHKQRRL